MGKQLLENSKSSLDARVKAIEWKRGEQLECLDDVISDVVERAVL